MNCLHICNDFLGSKVHENLYKSLNEIGVEQTIFHPLRKHNISKLQKGNKDFVINSRPLKKYHRILFRLKIKYLYKDLIHKIDPSKYQVTHATTLFSDGAISLRLKQNYSIPYIVAVRSTDVDSFLKYRPDLISLGLEILKEASKIIFISNTLKDKFLNHKTISKYKKEIEDKSHIISNGIDSFWINHQNPIKTTSTPHKILYVGTFIKRKNVDKLMQAVLQLNSTGTDCQLTIVGKGGALQNEVEQLSEQHKSTINYIGPIYEKSRLQEIYNRHHIFALPSKIETFGLVYLEALSQGLPILFTEREGIDGLFNFNIGEKCKILDTKEIATKIGDLLKNYNNYSLDMIDFSEFNWGNIAKTYYAMYKEILELKDSE